MPRAVPIQTNFTAGEISPRLRGRVDLNKYFNGAERLKNFIVKPQGGIFSRPGTIFSCEVKDSSKTTVLIEFEYSDVQSFVIEVGHLYMRFIKDHIRVESPPGTPVEIVTPYLESEVEFLQVTQSADILYITHPAHPPMQLERLSDTSWQLVEYEHFDGPYLPQNDLDITMKVSNVVDDANIESTQPDFGGGDVGNFVEYTRDGFPVLGEVLANVDANNNTIKPVENIIAPIDPTAVVTEAAGTATSTVAIFSNNNVGSYIKISNGDWHLITSYTSPTSVGVGAALTMVTTTGDLFVSGRIITADVLSTEDVFVASDVGRHMRFNFSSEQVWGTILTYIDAKNIEISLDRAVPLKVRDPSALIDDGKTILWRLGAWSASTGYPSCVEFHEERLCFAASPFQPTTTWMSVSGNYNSHSPTDNQSKVLDDSAITYTIASKKVNAIKWLNSGPTLIIGTFGSEWQVRAAQISDPITPTNISVQQHTTYGSGNIRPLRVGPSVLFMQRNGRKIRELIYDYASDSLIAKDLTIVNEQIIRQGIKAKCVAYQQEPNSIYWVALEDGRLAGMTYVRDQEVYAWHPHELGGSFNGSYAKVMSLACISNLAGVEDELFMIVKRTINGQTKQYIEYMSAEVDPADPTDKDDLNFVDCSIPYNGAAITVLPGYTHLVGQTVQIWADGAVRAPVAVSGGGTVTFTIAATKIFAGLPYSSLVKNLPPEAGNPLGSAQGTTKRVDRIAILFHESMSFKFGPSESKLVQWNNRIGDAPMDASGPLFSDWIDMKFDGPYEKAGSMVIVRDGPTPLNILALVTGMDTSVG